LRAAAINKFWTVPQIWDGDTCFIVGGGPSIAKVDIDRLRGKGRFIAVNNAYKIANWFEVMFYGDKQWLRAHGRGLSEFPGLKITAENREYPTDCWIDSLGIKVIEREFSANGISTNADLLFWNQSSGACAINLATLLGADKIILLGFDMQRVEGKSNYHNDYQPIEKRFDPYYKFLPPFEVIGRDLKNLGITCLNATPDSALKSFPFVKLEDIGC
jgi:hypothetical protein